MAIDLMWAFENEPPPLDFIWPGFLAGTVGALVAPGATGKSYWALEAAMCIACSVAGGDVLQNVQEHNVEGYLEVSEDAKFANFYAKFPDDHGVVAGRIDYTGCRGEAPSMYFHAIACRAHINYGIWQGVIHRDGDTPADGRRRRRD